MSQHHALIKNDPRWKAARAECIERDGGACVSCGSTDQLDADHIVRLSEEPALAFELSNLQTLCRPCHIEKEKQYDELVRVTWINPAYGYLRELVEEKEKESEEPAPFF